MPSSAHSADDFEKTFTLDDLRDWQRSEPSLAVVGKPVHHSLSPRMHNAALDELARTLPHFAQWRYFKFEIDPADIGEALHLFHKNRFLGINLTLPHKVIACDHVAGMSGLAQAIGAVNTLIWHDIGYYGHNTDGPGFVRGLREELDVAAAGAHVVLLGAGGAARAIAALVLQERWRAARAARAIAAVLLQEGCRALWVVNRNPERLAGLVGQLQTHFPDDTARLRAFTTDQFPSSLPADSIVVNATQLGLKPGDPSPFPAALLSAGMVAYDTIYEPAETTFLKNARQAGLPAANGLSMLCWQGALALELWTRTRAPVHAMANALKPSNPENDTDAA